MNTSISNFQIEHSDLLFILTQNSRREINENRKEKEKKNEIESYIIETSDIFEMYKNCINYILI